VKYILISNLVWLGIRRILIKQTRGLPIALSFKPLVARVIGGTLEEN